MLIFVLNIDTLKFSLFKTKADQSRPKPKTDLVLVYAEDVLTMPITNERGILTGEEITLKPNAQFYNLYLTPAQQKIISSAEGEVGVRGWKPTITGSFPGTNLEVSEWLHNNINQAFIVIQPNCKTSYKIYGHRYNPLFITGSFTDDNENSISEITLEANRKTKKPFIIYDGNYTPSPSDNDNYKYLIDLLN